MGLPWGMDPQPITPPQPDEPPEISLCLELGRAFQSLGIPAHRFEDALKATVDWYVNHPSWWQRIRSGEYRQAYQTLYGWRDEQCH